MNRFRHARHSLVFVLPFVFTICLRSLADDGLKLSISSEVSSFFNGERAKFRSGGNPKAFDLDMEFQYPKCWKRSAGIRPHILVDLESPADGGAFCYLQIRSLSEKMASMLGCQASQIRNEIIGLAPQDIECLANAMFSRETQLQEYLAISRRPVADFSTKRVSIEQCPAAITIGRIAVERCGVILEGQMSVVSILYKDSLVAVGTLLPKTDTETDYEFRARCKLFEPLIFGMANSVVIHDKYK